MGFRPSILAFPFLLFILIYHHLALFFCLLSSFPFLCLLLITALLCFLSGFCNFLSGLAFSLFFLLPFASLAFILFCNSPRTSSSFLLSWPALSGSFLRGTPFQIFCTCGILFCPPSSPRLVSLDNKIY